MKIDLWCNSYKSRYVTSIIWKSDLPQCGKTKDLLSHSKNNSWNQCAIRFNSSLLQNFEDTYKLWEWNFEIFTLFLPLCGFCKHVQKFSLSKANFTFTTSNGSIQESFCYMYMDWSSKSNWLIMNFHLESQFVKFARRFESVFSREMKEF